MHQHFSKCHDSSFSSMSDGPCNFKGVIISSLHGWSILSFHPFLNRFLDSSDSFKFPYYNTLCSRRLSSLFINNLSSQSWSCSSLFSIPLSITPFTFLMSKHCWYKGKNLPLFSHDFCEQVMLFYASIPMHTQFSQEVSWYAGKPYCLSHIKTSSSFYLFLHFKVVFI